MEEEKISLDHQAFLEPRLRALGSDFIDYSFTNLYIFRDVHDFRLVQKKQLYIRGKSRDGVSYLMPLVPASEIDWQEVKGELLFPLSEQAVATFDSSQFEWRHADLDDDYLYRTEKLAHLPGRKLSSRRNLVHQFLDHYPTHETHSLMQERAGDALQVLEEWQSHPPHGDPRFTDYEACKEALGLIDRLRLAGCITYVDKKPVGFLLGEELNAKTYVYHVAKALTQFKGIYQYLFEHCAQSIEGQYEWINLGQDIGSPDIRQSKRSYQPDRLLVKFRVKQK